MAKGIQPRAKYKRVAAAGRNIGGRDKPAKLTTAQELRLIEHSEKNANTATVRGMMQTRRKTYLEAASTAGVKRRRRVRRRRK
jgi:hypothetical protein